MRIYALIFISELVLFSCVENSDTSAIDVNDSIAEIVKEGEENKGIEEKNIELNKYQLAVQNFKTTHTLPHNINVQTNTEFYAKETLDFQGIIKVRENYFVLEYRTYDAEVENVYFFTFDYNGNQLDAEFIYNVAIDLDGAVAFSTDSTFQVNNEIKEIEWVEDDLVEVGEAKKDTNFYSISNHGEIQKINKQ